MSSLETDIDIAESLATFARGEHIQRYAGVKVLKLQADLDRYEKIIKAAKPDVIIETGGRHGGSALWFAEHCGVRVISIDIVANHHRPQHELIAWVAGNTSDGAVWLRVRKLIEPDERVMVVLDSDHTAPHVKAEIELYGPLVSPGQYLVVEDTIFAYSTPEQLHRLTLDPLIDFGTPMDAVEQLLVPDPAWERDRDIEALHSTAHSPAGWWRRRG